MNFFVILNLWGFLFTHSALAQYDPHDQSAFKSSLSLLADSESAKSRSICNGTIQWIPHGLITAGFLEKSEELMFADINGDGRDDYLAVDPQGVLKAWFNKATDSQGKIMWEPQGVIGTKTNIPPSKMRFADITGNGLVDYLVVDDKPANVHMWENGGRRNSAGYYIWTARGIIASGGKDIPNNRVDGAGLFFADIDGDGRADYVWLDTDGTAWVWINSGFNRKGQLAWTSKGNFTLVPGAKRADIRLTDIDGDGKTDYLWVDPTSKDIKWWRNDGEGPNGKWNWEEKGTVASGIGIDKVIDFARLTGSGRADYLSTVPGGQGAVELWENGCASKSSVETKPELK